MKENLGSIVFRGKYMDLNALSIEELKDIFSQMNDEEMMIKQELDSMLKRLV